MWQIPFQEDYTAQGAMGDNPISPAAVFICGFLVSHGAAAEGPGLPEVMMQKRKGSAGGRCCNLGMMGKGDVPADL